MRFNLVLPLLPKLAVIAMALAAGTGLAQITAVPPAEYIGPPVPKAAPIQRLLPTDAPHRAVALGAPNAIERDALKAINAASDTGGKPVTGVGATGKGHPLAIGYGRTVPVTDRTISGADLAWQPLADGGRAARIDVSSDGAAALRVAVAMTATDPDISVRFAGSAEGAEVFGPYPANRIAEETTRDGKYWSPVLDGSTATIEVFLPSDVPPNSVGLTLVGVSHLVVAGNGLRKVDQKVLNIGTSEACEIDVKCVAPQTAALSNSARSVAKIIFTQENGGSFLCSGTLINDSTSSNTPYFYTADH